MTDFVKLRLGEGDACREYAIMRMPPGKALYFIPKVTKALAPVLMGEGDLMSLANGGGDISGAAKLILGGLKEIDPEIMTDLAKEAMQHECYAGPKKLSDTVHFDSWFNQYPQDMIQVMGWAIWQNCKDFFPGGSAAMDSLVAKVQANAALQSQKAGSQNTQSEES